MGDVVRKDIKIVAVEPIMGKIWVFETREERVAKKTGDTKISPVAGQASSYQAGGPAGEKKLVTTCLHTGLFFKSLGSCKTTEEPVQTAPQAVVQKETVTKTVANSDRSFWQIIAGTPLAVRNYR